MAVAVVYDRSGIYDCSKCSLNHSLEHQCTRVLERKHPDWEDDPNLLKHTAHWFQPDEPQYAEETCWRFQVDDESWALVEDARLMVNYGVLFNAGGIADQPLWWWLRVQAVRDLIRDFEHTQRHAPESLQDVVKQFQEQVAHGLVSSSSRQR